MSVTHRPAAVVACGLLVGLLLGLPACTQKMVAHQGAVGRLLTEYEAPSYYDEAFEPVPEEELASFELPEAVPYTLGVDDTLVVKVLSAQPVSGFEQGVEVRVKEDGTIRLPTVGTIEAKDKTALQLEEALLEPFRRDFVKDAIVSVEIRGFASRRFFVVGEVGSPGTLPVNGKTTLLEALITAGGTNQKTADLNEAYVIREQKPIPFSINDVVMRGHPAGQLVMAENDILYVPHVKERTDYVYVFGEVGKPARVPMDHLGPPGSTGALTLAAALGQVGGLNPRANINSIAIYRGSWPHPQQYCLGVCDLYKHGADIQLRPGDRIAVGTSAAAKFSDALGPGLQVLGAGTSSLSLALSAVALSKN